MTGSQGSQGAPQGSPDDDALTDAVLALLAVDAGVDATAASLAVVLAIPAAVALAFLRALGAKVLSAFKQATLAPAAGSAVGITAAANMRYRAAFIKNALRRIAAAPDVKIALKRELGFFVAHVDAGKRRKVMGKRVDFARGKYGDLLGWYAKMDKRTSAECRAANGRNFEALVPPVIGYPGSVHPHCRCVPGPPFEGAKMVNDSLTVRRSDAATGFYRRSI